MPSFSIPKIPVDYLKNSKSGPAVFYRLSDLEPGHLIEIERSEKRRFHAAHVRSPRRAVIAAIDEEVAASVAIQVP